MEAENESGILVAGAGPVGLTLACELRRRGVLVRVVDDRPGRSQHSKALAIFPRTLEMLQLMGLAGTFVAAGNRLRGLAMHAEGSVLASISFDSLSSPFPFALCLPQSETERLLEEQFETLGGHVERSCSFAGLQRSVDKAVKVRLRRADGYEETTTVSWLIGCDGAHSAVRHAIGASFAGSRYEESFVLADVHVTGDVPMDEVNLHLASDGVVGFVPFGGGRARVVATQSNQTAQDIASPPPSLEDFQVLVDRRAGRKVQLSHLEWASRFRVSRRKVDQMRNGRVFLAGDAAHIHSPAGGQGMNTGIQDACNLAWKLALVWQGRAPESLLDSYNGEREPIAENVLQLTDRATRMVLIENPVLQSVRDHLIPLFSSFARIRHQLVDALSELTIDYTQSGIVGQSGHGPMRAGERVPDGELSELATGRSVRIFDLLRHPDHTLLVFDNGHFSETDGTALTRLTRAALGDEVAVWTIFPHGSAGRKSERQALYDSANNVWSHFAHDKGAVVLVRPDAYIGFHGEGASVEALGAYLRRVFESDSDSVPAR